MTRLTPEETDGRSALAAFLRAPALREAANLYLGNIAILLHLLSDSVESIIVRSRITPPLAAPKVETIWTAW